MKCPACGHGLAEKKIGDLRAGACEGGCGGLWFDTFELQPADQDDEAALESLLYIKRNRRITVDFSRRRICPRCGDAALNRVLFGPGSRANVDECPHCGGCWLDDGELAQLHFEWSQGKDAAKSGESADSAGLAHYLYELRTGHRKGPTGA